MLKRFLTASAALVVVAACGDTPAEPTSLDRGTVIAAAPGTGNDNSQGAQFVESNRTGFRLYTVDGECRGSYSNFPKVSDFDRWNPNGSLSERKQYDVEFLRISTPHGEYYGSGMVRFSRSTGTDGFYEIEHWTVTGRVADAAEDLYTVVCRFDLVNGEYSSSLRLN